jgi:glycosyltransferase involved in cell wall biosynthesis
MELASKGGRRMARDLNDGPAPGASDMAVPAEAGARVTRTWGLCVSTLNRIDILEDCVRRALAQTRPPAEVVVVDASDAWEAHRDRIAPLVEAAGLPLHYVPSDRKSLTAQRNRGLSLLSADIAFLLDDDALMREDCAATIMDVYERDAEGVIVGVSATNARGPSGTAVEKKNAGGLGAPWAQRMVTRSAAVRWVLREVLMTARDRIFIRYDDETGRRGPEAVAALGIPDIVWSQYLPGWGMTVRREVALREPFDGTLLAYCPTEDLDASYRFARHGANVIARNAHLDHVEVAAGRIKRRQAAMLSVMNSAYLTRKNSKQPARHVAIYYVYAVRRLVAEFLKDAMTGRLTFPQLQGMAEGIARSPGIFRHDRGDLERWYENYQRRLLSRGR